MLSTLKIENIAIIEDIEIDFTAGLNVLTGETGAGKSIILKCIDILCGKKSTPELLRTGCDRGTIQGVLNFSADSIEQVRTSLEVDEQLEGVAELLPEPEVIIRRVLDKKGRGKCYVNGTLVSQSNLHQLMSRIVQITGQHDYQALRSPERYRDVLDSYGVPSHALQATTTAFRSWSTEQAKLRELRSSRSSVLERFEALQAMLQALTSAELTRGEKEQLITDLDIAKHHTKVTDAVQDALACLESESRSSETEGVLTLLGRAQGSLEDASRYDPSLTELLKLSSEAHVLIEELSGALTSYLNRRDGSTLDLDSIQDRLTIIKQLERRFGKSEEELITYRDELQNELSKFDANSFDEEALSKKVDECWKNYQRAADHLTKEREKRAKHVQKEVTKQLAQLGLPKASFSIHIAPGGPSAKGSDHVQFLFSANPGEPMRELDTVASGGELSRLQLILKSLSADANEFFVQIFDEIDVGVGGAIAQMVGEKLRMIAEHSQTLVITHAAQVAALADNHILVQKHVEAGRTYCEARILAPDERVETIAGMLAGKNVTGDFLASARQLMSGN